MPKEAWKAEIPPLTNSRNATRGHKLPRTDERSGTQTVQRFILGLVVRISKRERLVVEPGELHQGILHPAYADVPPIEVEFLDMPLPYSGFGTVPIFLVLGAVSGLIHWGTAWPSSSSSGSPRTHPVRQRQFMLVAEALIDLHVLVWWRRRDARANSALCPDRDGGSGLRGM